MATQAGTASSSVASPEDLVPGLVLRSREGDREAFSALVVHFQDVVYNMIHQRLGDPHAALDAAQETFVKAFGALASFRGESTFKSWLLSIALREAENQRRKKARQLPAGALQGVEPADRSPSPSRGLESDDDAAIVRRALGEAPEEDARLILLRDVENLSYLEIAEVLEVPLGTVKSSLSRARARLRAALERTSVRGGGAA